MGRYVIGVSGASGIILAKRLVETLLELHHQVELVLTAQAQLTARIELGEKFSFAENEKLTIYPIHALHRRIASGSFLWDAMVVVPCSMATLAAISLGLSDNLLRRSADVTLKERRPLIIVPRETPLSSIHLQNMLHLSQVGATILMPLPGWYTQPQSIEDVENFIVGKVLDALKIDHQLYKRWEG